METRIVEAGFTIEMTPGQPLLEGVGTMAFTKQWTGGMEGSSQGVMLGAGDPEQGEAGYVAMEVFTGSIEGRNGSVTLQQSGLMRADEPDLAYLVVPGSGTGELAGLDGSLELTVVDGVHRVRLALLG